MTGLLASATVARVQVLKKAVSLCLLLLAACKRDAPAPEGAASAAPVASAAPTGSASAAASVTTASAMAPESAAPRGTGVAELKTLAEVGTCKPKNADLASYVQKPALGLAGRADGTFAAVWLVELQNDPDAQIAFAGFDGEARQVARARGIGTTRFEGLRLLESGGAWSASWFDAEGLTHTRPRWEAVPPPEIQHLAAVGKEGNENVAVAPTPAGSLVAAAPFGPQRDQLGVFLFASTDPAEPTVKAVGVTHHARQPRRPAVAADAGGYFVAWHEEDGSIRASHFDAAGKEGSAHVIAPEGPKRERVALTATSAGAIALWAEGETLLARALDAGAQPAGPTWVVGKGKWGVFTPGGQGALVAWVGHDGKADAQLLLARLSPEGAPSAQGLRVSDGVTAVKDPPALAAAGSRVGLAWTEMMGPAVSSKRALLRLVDLACVP